MANWRELERKVDGKMTAAYGEMVRISFLKNGVIDPARPLVDVRALLSAGGDDSFAPGSGMRVRLTGGQGELVLDRSYTGPMPVAKDKVRALDRDGQPWFEVQKVSARYSNLIVLSLNQA